MTEENENPEWYKPHDKRFKWSPEKLKEAAASLDKWVDKAIKNDDDFLLGDWCFRSGLGFLPQSFGRYLDRSPELEAAYNRAKQWQEHKMSKGALHNQLNSKFASMWLSHAHGWKVNANEEETKKLTGDMGEFMELQKQLYESYKQQKMDY